MRRRHVLTLLTVAMLAFPALAGVTPERRPRIFCEYGSRDGAVDPAQVRIYLDGADVTTRARVTSFRVDYLPEEDLAIGRHHVLVVVEDDKGRRGKKRWSFEVDPTAPDPVAPTIAFVAPTPGNGEVVAASRVRIEAVVHPGSAPLAPAGIRVWTSKDGGAWKEETARAGLDADRVILLLEGPETGAWTVRVEATDSRGGRAPTAYTAFIVDRSAPDLEAIDVRPNPFFPVALDATDATDATCRIVVKLTEEPAGRVRTVRLLVRNGPNEVRRLDAAARGGRAAFAWDGRDEQGRLVGDADHELVFLLEEPGRTWERPWEGVLKVRPEVEGPPPPTLACQPNPYWVDPAGGGDLEALLTAEGASWTRARLAVHGENGVVAVLEGAARAGAWSFAWDGRDRGGDVVATGDYRLLAHLEGEAGASRDWTWGEVLRVHAPVPPSFKVVLRPNPTTATPGATVAITLLAEGLPGGLAEAGLTLLGDGAPAGELPGTVVDTEARFRWDLEGARPGVLRLAFRLVDGRGRTHRHEAPTPLVVKPSVAVEAAALALRLDAPKARADRSPLPLSGRTVPGAEIRVSVNGSPTATGIADGLGDFAISVPIEPGRNRLAVRAVDLVSGAESREAQATSLLVPDPGLAGPPEVVEPTHGTTTTLSVVPIIGRTLANVDVRILVNGNLAAVVRANRLGGFKVPAVNLVYGANEVICQSISVEGRTGPPSAPVQVTRVDETKK